MDAKPIIIRKQKKSSKKAAAAAEDETKQVVAPAQPTQLEWIEEPFVLIKSYFEGQHLDRLVRHQIESYNHFTNFQLNRTIEMFNPIVAHSENDIMPETGKYKMEVRMYLDNFKLYPPQIHENNGATKLMFPQEARLRNFTYASVMTVDVNVKYVIQDPNSTTGERIITKVLPKINIGKLPIMLKSSICLLTQNKQLDPTQTGECKYDCGGYFIINGSEKTVLSQERAAENRVYCFCGKNTTKWSWYAEIKSVPDFKCISPKQIEVLIANKNNGFGNPIYINIPRVKIPIDLFVVFRALGVESDRDICERILLGSAMPAADNKKLICMRELLHASIMEANKYMTKEDAIKHITSYVAFVPINMDKEQGAIKKREFAIEILNNDLFPHCQTMEQKIYFLGYMTNILLQTSIGWLPPDDRDSYVNKRIELTGTLLNNLFRNYFNKLVKEIQKQTIRELNSSTWRNTQDYENIINMINIYKILKPTTIENGIKRALSTGDFSIKQSNTSKVGVAQVLNRLTYASSLSHLRRINTPMEKSGELIAPRKLHNTTWGFLCLTGDVEVLLSNRMETKKIRDLKDGDWVTTINRTTLEEEPSPIYNWFCKMPEKLFEVTTISGRKIKATPEHPLLVAREGNVYEMVNVEDLLPGDRLVIRHVPTITNKIIDIESFHTKRLEESPKVEFLKIKEFNKEVNYEMEFDYSNKREYYIKELTKYNCSILNNGAVGVPILSIVEVEPELVYDFTTFSENHSFVAASIVSKNCSPETPEGQSIGLVKNLSYMTHVTIPSNSAPLYHYVMPFVEKLEDLKAEDLYGNVKVFVNGAWVGITKRALELYENMKNKKYSGMINIYTSIVFNYKLMEIRICNDGGRFTRPLLRVGNNSLLLTAEMIDKIDRGEIHWNDLLCGENSVIEYIDPEEQNCNVMCAMKPSDLSAPPAAENIVRPKYTHCEIHPSTIFGVLASCIPFPEHNQAPRNAYQCCMSKQSIGMYSTNFDQRMDKTAYVMTYPTRPLVDTRVMNFIKLNEIPSGAQAIVAIMTHTGYNQEDSILINKGSIDRGMFMATIYHTEKDENKKINGDEQIRCRPDPAKTKGMKFGNYQKVNNQGFIPENTLVENRDIIISKVLPIKENRNDPTKTIKYEDQSKSYTTAEQTYIDKNYMGRNGDGYNFAKVRTRTLRKPVIGDKFASRAAQKGTVGNIIPEEDMPFIGNTGLRPDIIINPHCFVGESLISLPHGLSRRLESFSSEGLEKLFSFSDNGILRSESLGLESKGIKDTVKLTMRDGREIICTPDHKIRVAKNGTYEWKEAGELTEHDNILMGPRGTEDILYDDEVDWELKMGEFSFNMKTPVERQRALAFARISAYIGKCYNSLEFNCIMSHFDIDNISDDVEFAFNNKVSLFGYIYSHNKYNIILEDKHLSFPKSFIREFLAVELSYFANLPNLNVGFLNISIPTNTIENVNLYIKLLDKVGVQTQIENDRLYIKSASELLTKVGFRYNINKSLLLEIAASYEDYRNRATYPVTPEKYTEMCGVKNWFNQGIIVGRNDTHIPFYTLTIAKKETHEPREVFDIGVSVMHAFIVSGVCVKNCIPSRMTIAQLKEMLLCKALVELGLYGDGTAFGDLDIKEHICKIVQDSGFESYGNEVMYNGLTGEQVEANIFIGPCFYQRLKHMVNDKVHSRATGPMVILNRQPTEGRSKGGGLRLGEMERDCLSSGGYSAFLRERFYDAADKFSVYVCRKCGLIAAYNDKCNIHLCKTCENRSDFSYVEVPYSFKLLSQELQTINVVPRLITE